jgi:hypothetical protein
MIDASSVDLQRSRSKRLQRDYFFSRVSPSDGVNTTVADCFYGIKLKPPSMPCKLSATDWRNSCPFRFSLMMCTAELGVRRSVLLVESPSRGSDAFLAWYKSPVKTSRKRSFREFPPATSTCTCTPRMQLPPSFRQSLLLSLVSSSTYSSSRPLLLEYVLLYATTRPKLFSRMRLVGGVDRIDTITSRSDVAS